MSEKIYLNIENLTRMMTGVEATDWMLPLFWSLARKYPQCKVAEIGMRGGTSTLAWLMGVRESGGHVWSMDIRPCEDTIQSFQNLGLDHLHTFICADSGETDFPGDQKFDILFIDGDHTNVAVHRDYHRHAERVAEGGIILFHDTRSCHGVLEVVRSVGGTDIPLGAGLGIKTVGKRDFGISQVR